MTAEALPFYLDVGMSLLKLGEEARVDLAGFSLDGPANKDLRYIVRRAERDGLSFEVIPRAAVPGMIDELAAISNAWLNLKNVGEKRFSVGYFDPAYLAEFDLGVVRLKGRIVAFANLWQGADGGTASIDLMRYLPDASPFTMDYLFTKLLLWAKERGYADFQLGSRPAVRAGGAGAGAAVEQDRRFGVPAGREFLQLPWFTSVQAEVFTRTGSPGIWPAPAVSKPPESWQTPRP